MGAVQNGGEDVRPIDADYITEGRVSNDPVVIAAKCAPTIPAIPVEWLQKYAPEKWSMYMQAAVEIIIEAWQKEQEAQDG